MRVHHDLALRGLPEDVGEAADGQQPGVDDVVEHRSRPHGGQLVHVPYQDDDRVRWEGAHQLVR